MTHAVYLISAYTVVWILICFFLATLVIKNHRLKRDMEELESRLNALESELEQLRDAS